MKRKKSLTMLWCGAAAAMLLGGCSKEAAEPGRYGDGEGSLTISAVSMPQIAVNDATRAGEPTLALTSIVPDASKFTEEWAMKSLRTRVVCVEDDAAYDAHAFTSANAYNDENPRLTPVPAKYSVTMGMPKADGKLHDYTTVTGPDAPRYRETHPGEKLVPVVPEGEGVDFIYFEGYATATVESGTEPTPVPVEVKVANTAVTVEFTEAFCKYFANGAAITLTTAGGFTKEIASYEAGETPAQASKHYFWVRPQAFTLTGVATPQTPSPGHIEAEPVALKFEMKDDASNPKTVVNPQTLYRMTFDAETTGASGAIKVKVDDTVIDIVDLGVEELNPNPKNDD